MKIIIANPKDKEHVRLFKEYKEELSLDYLNKKNQTEIKTILFNIKDDKLNNISYIYGHSDLKSCHLYFENYDFSNLSFLNQVTDYAKDVLEMENISYHIPNDNKIINKLESSGYILLGALNDSDHLIMEKADDPEIGPKRR